MAMMSYTYMDCMVANVPSIVPLWFMFEVQMTMMSYTYMDHMCEQWQFKDMDDDIDSNLCLEIPSQPLGIYTWTKMKCYMQPHYEIDDHAHEVALLIL
jgi:hypothetical protein